MIDLCRETLLSTDSAVDWLRKTTGHAYCRITIVRWMSKGLRGIVLESCKIGHRKYTSVEALGRFSCRLSETVSTPIEINGPIQPQVQNRDREQDKAAVQGELNRIFAGARGKRKTR